MDNKTSLHTDDPFSAAAGAANAPEATIAAVPETRPGEVVAALEMPAAFVEDREPSADNAQAPIEASNEMRPLDGQVGEVGAPERAADSVPDEAAGPVVGPAPGSLEPAEPHEPLAARPEAPWAVPTHAEHRDGPPLSASEDPQTDEPFDTIEDGIASIFARLHAETREAQHEEHDDEVCEADDAVTFQLLGELDRLWHRAER